MVSRLEQPLPVHSQGPAEDLAWAARVRRVLDERMLLLAELDRATERQEEVIASRDTQALMDLLDVRQRVVDRFVAGQGELLSLTETFESHVCHLDSALAESLRTSLRTLFDGLSRVTSRDEAAQDALRQAREETRGELMRAHTGGGARSAYRSSTNLAARDPGDTARFADRRA